MLPTESNTEPEEYEEEETNLSEMEAKEDLMAELSDRKNLPGNTTNQSTGMREATISTKCFNYEQCGHYKSDCPQRSKSKFTTRQSVLRSTIEVGCV